MNIQDVQLIILHSLLIRGGNSNTYCLEQSKILAKQFLEDAHAENKEDTP